MIKYAILGIPTEQSVIVRNFAVAAVPIISSHRGGWPHRPIAWTRRQYGWWAGWQTAVNAREVFLVDPPLWARFGISLRRRRTGASPPVVLRRSEGLTTLLRSMAPPTTSSG